MANEPDLQPGQSSDWVLYLQKKLNYLYYQQTKQTVVQETGSYDQATINAIQHYRQQNELPAGSGVDADVWAKLEGGALGRLTGAAGAGKAGQQAGQAGAQQASTGHPVVDELAAFYNQLDELNKDTVDALGMVGLLTPDALVQANVLSTADQQVAAALQGRGVGGLIAAYQPQGQQGQQDGQTAQA